MSENKPIHAKPSLYAYYFLQLKEIALKYGYNLVLHGSMARDLDLIACPWQAELGSHEEMIEEFAKELGGYILLSDHNIGTMKYDITYHGRIRYVININRGGKHNDYLDPQYYIDISVMPTADIMLPIHKSLNPPSPFPQLPNI